MLIAHSFYGLTVPPNSSVSLTATCKDLPDIFPPPENQNPSKVLALSTFYLSLLGGSMVKIICLQCRRPRCNLWVEKIPWRKEWLPTSSILAWRIPWTEEPCRPQSMGSQRVRHDWVTTWVLSLSHFHYLSVQDPSQEDLILTCR